MRAKKVIDAEIARLKKMKPFIPARSAFGDDNHAELEMTIDVLEKNLNDHQIELKYYQDETAEEFRDGDNDLWSLALSVTRWRDGDDEDRPSDGWEPVARGRGFKG